MQNPMEERKKVLITGAAGRIGSSLRVLMKDRYRLRLMFHSKVLPVEEDEEVVIGDLCDFEKMSEACEGVDAVVHMGGLAGGGDFPGRLVPVNIVGTYNVLEAARRQGVHKVIFASTNHVTGYYEKEGVYTTPDMPVRPDGTYGVSKAAGEALARYYVDAFGMSVHCLRIGSFLGGEPPKGRGVRSLSTWISQRDMAQLVWRCIESDLPFGIFYGISDNTRKYWDITNARELIGYAPEDDAEEYADEVEGHRPEARDQRPEIRGQRSEASLLGF